jgi:hypothetical protein
LPSALPLPETQAFSSSFPFSGCLRGSLNSAEERLPKLIRRRCQLNFQIHSVICLEPIPRQTVASNSPQPHSCLLLVLGSGAPYLPSFGRYGSVDLAVDFAFSPALPLISALFQRIRTLSPRPLVIMVRL